MLEHTDCNSQVAQVAAWHQYTVYTSRHVCTKEAPGDVLTGALKQWWPSLHSTGALVHPPLELQDADGFLEGQQLVPGVG